MLLEFCDVQHSGHQNNMKPSYDNTLTSAVASLLITALVHAHMIMCASSSSSVNAVFHSSLYPQLIGKIFFSLISSICQYVACCV